jgi:hypothetical protein
VQFPRQRQQSAVGALGCCFWTVQISLQNPKKNVKTLSPKKKTETLKNPKKSYIIHEKNPKHPQNPKNP